jgi:hypothetical protein
MERKTNTDTKGRTFSEVTVKFVWRNGREMRTFNPGVWRYDVYGLPIRYADFGNIESPYGWEVDHILPVAAGGTDDLTNLQPLHWENNRQKGDSYPWSGPHFQG